MNQGERFTSLLDLLAIVPAGKATITVRGRPFLSIDSDEKTLEVETDGAKEAGLRLSDLVRLREGQVGVLEGSEHAAGALSRLGWKLTLCAEEDRVLMMVSGVSRLTGRISVNPLKLRRLREALR
jgi:hypothetical protein